MNLSKYLNIERLEFIVTSHCTGRCKHCSFIDRVTGKPLDGFHAVNKEKAIEFVNTICKHFKVKSVMTFGGEPLLYPEITAAIHNASAKNGVCKRQIITNGYFTKSESRISEVAQLLKESGVNDLLLSVDSFHQEIIPIDKVYYFASMLKKEGINTRLQPAWVVNRDNKNLYNEKTEKILKHFYKLGLYENEGNDIFLSGNAVKYLSQFYPKPQLNLESKCGEMPYTEKLTKITSLSLEPNGEVKACDFVIGNIYKDSIEDILASYDPYRDEWMNAVTLGGAKELLKLAESKGLIVNTENCSSVCDVCRKIQKCKNL